MVVSVVAAFFQTCGHVETAMEPWSNFPPCVVQSLRTAFVIPGATPCSQSAAFHSLCWITKQSSPNGC